MVTAHDYTMYDAFKKAKQGADQIMFTNKYYRTDMTDRDFHLAPLKRYDAMQALKLT